MRGLPLFFANIFPTDLETGTIGSIELNVWLAQVSGLPILGLKKETLKLKALLLLYGFPTILLVTFAYMCFELYDLTLCWPNLDDMTQNSCLSLTHLAGTYKIMNTFYRLTDISNVIEKFKFLTRKFVSSPEQRVDYLRHDSHNKIFLMGFATLVGFTGIFGIFMLYYNPKYFAGKTFPYRVYLPDWLPNHIRMVYMGFGVFLFAIQIVSIDYLNITLINQLRFHLSVLNLKFRELIVSNDTDDDCGREHTKLHNFTDPNDILHTIVDHHRSLKRLKVDIEDIFRVPLLMQFGTSLLIFALTGFQATVQERDANSAVIYLYCGCIFCELFFYCWFGNEVFEQNKTLAITGYSCSWYKFDNRFKKSLLIFLINAQRPMIFTAGGFINLFLPTFAGILSKAYTYIAVLRQLYGKWA